MFSIANFEFEPHSRHSSIENIIAYGIIVRSTEKYKCTADFVSNKIQLGTKRLYV